MEQPKAKEYGSRKASPDVLKPHIYIYIYIYIYTQANTHTQSVG